MEFDKGLAVGQFAEVRWTNSHNAYRAVGKVVKVNAKSVVVALSDAIYAPKYDKAMHAFEPGEMVYEAGRTIAVPRCILSTMQRWSFNNCVMPVSL